jgi:hypothetical protein
MMGVKATFMNVSLNVARKAAKAATATISLGFLTGFCVGVADVTDVAGAADVVAKAVFDDILITLLFLPIRTAQQKTTPAP